MTAAEREARYAHLKGIASSMGLSASELAVAVSGYASATELVETPSQAKLERAEAVVVWLASELPTVEAAGDHIAVTMGRRLGVELGATWSERLANLVARKVARRVRATLTEALSSRTMPSYERPNTDDPGPASN